MSGDIENCSDPQEICSNNEKPQNIDIEQGNSMNIIDLNDDCLEHIFLYVEVSDLVHLVEASKKFELAAGNSFKANHQSFTISKYLQLTCMMFPPVWLLQLERCQSRILSGDEALTTISYFGQFTKNLYIEVNSDFETRLLDKITEMCGDHLLSLRIDMWYNTNNCGAPFSAAWIKFFNNIHISFPKLQVLRIPICENFNIRETLNASIFKPIEQAYPSLVEFDAFLFDHLDSQSIKNVLRLNPQLRSLRLIQHCECAYGIVLLDLDINLPNLTLLGLNIKCCEDLVRIPEHVKPNRFRNLNELCIDTHENIVENIFNLLAFAGDNINKLTLKVIGSAKFIPSMSNSVLQTIYRCKNIKYLCFIDKVRVDDIVHLVRSLPLLESLSVSRYSLTHHKIRQLLRDFPRLIDFEISSTASYYFLPSEEMKYHKEIADLLNDTKWKSIDTNNPHLSKLRRLL